MKNYGDICKISGYKVPLVDVITGGSPCQDLSVAGKRAGLKHSEMGDDETTRSGLFMEQIRIIKEQRNESKKQLSMRQSVVDFRHIQPRYTVWENVCGAFSSNNGEDFRAVLEETCKVADENAYVPQLAKGQKWANAGCIMGDGYSVAWRVHDAQFWGVPQRRKRICVLADYGGHTAPEILFELLGETNDPESYKIVTDIREQSRPEIQVVGKSLSGNTEQGNEKGQGVTETVTDSVGEASSYTLKIRGGVDIDSHGKRAGKGALVQTELSGTLGVSQDQTLITGECLNPWDVQSKHIQSENGVAESLYSGECRYGGGESYVMQSQSENSPTHLNPSVIGVDLYNQTATGDVAMSITGAATDPHHVPCVCVEPSCIDTSHADDVVRLSDNSPSLQDRDYKGGKNVLCFEPGSASRVGGHVYEESTGAVRANAGDNQQAVCYGVTTKGNGDAFINKETHTSLSTGGGEAGQGYPCVCYGISSYESNAMKSANPESGVYEADTSRTLDNNGGNPACNQGGMAVVYRGDAITSPVNGSNPQPNGPCHTLTDDSRNYVVYEKKATAFDCYNLAETGEIGRCLATAGGGLNEHIPVVFENQKDNNVQVLDGLNNATSEEVSPTLMCQRQDVKNIPSVAYGLDRASFNQGKNAKFSFSVDEELAPSLVAKGPGGVCKVTQSELCAPEITKE